MKTANPKSDLAALLEASPALAAFDASMSICNKDEIDTINMLVNLLPRHGATRLGDDPPVCVAVRAVLDHARQRCERKSAEQSS